MYLRPIRVSELSAWLVEVKHDELNEEELAQKLVEKFDIHTYSRQAE